MTSRLRRVATSHLLVVAATLVLGAGLAAGALVGFSAETQTQTSTYAGGWLDAPTGLLTPTVSGYGASLTWSPGTHDLTGQTIAVADRGTTSDCTGVSSYPTTVTSGLATTLTTATDTTETNAVNGHWLCYQIRSTRGSWYTGSSFAVVQVGLVPAGIVVSPTGGSSGQIDNSDLVTLTFNQNIAYGGAATITVCAFVNSPSTNTSSGVILLGDTGCGSRSDTATIGAITGLNIPNANRTFASSGTGVVNGNQLRITIGGGSNGAQGRTAVTGTGTFTYTGSTVTSSAGSASVCTAANCTWAYSGGF